MNLERFNELLLESVGVGLAILQPDSLTLIYHNRRFSEWFPDARAGESMITDLIDDLNVDRLRERIGRSRPYTASAEVRVNRRVVSLSFSISKQDMGDSSFLILEGQNVSKIKELEYMIESYSNMVEKQNRKLEREKERAEKLLLNVMPRKVYEEIKAFGVTTPQRFDESSILMLDFVDFTHMAVAQDPTALIAELNDIFTSFDQIAEQFGCERIKTIGDAYMAVCGVPEPMNEHAQAIAKVALLFVRYLKRRNESQMIQWRCRVGINSGPVIGSIVGVQKYVYDIFGPGVNLAARMEELSDPMEVTLCEDMYRLIRTDYRFEERGEMEVKGFGVKQIYTLRGETPQQSQLAGLS